MTDTHDLDAAMLAVWKYGDWKQATLRMTHAQREAAAAAIDRAGHTSPHLRWWSRTFEKTGETGDQRFFEAIGKPMPRPLTAAEREEFDRAMEAAGRRADDLYGPLP
jgi:hypothetical protein